MSGQAQTGTKRERREFARLQREAVKRRIERRRRAARAGVVALVVVAVGVVGGVALLNSRRAGVLPGMLTGEAPWPANQAQLAARLDAAGLPALTAMEQLDFHIHQHLDVFVHGHPVEVPANIGIDPSVGIAVLHTHDATGVIHVESPERRDFTLGDFFDVWGVRLTDSCIGGYCNGNDGSLRAFVGGRPVQGDPRDLVLREHEEIVLAFGTPDELPHPVPATYEFPEGL